MQYENPQIPEGINVAKRNHLLDFLILTVGAILLILSLTFVVSLFSGYIAKKIPFEVELAFSQPFEELETLEDDENNRYLRSLVEKMARCSDLPDGMEIKYNYQESQLVNAFATLGGNLILFQGLINELDNENELAMIIAHEIAHIKNRHPIQSLGRKVILKLGLSLLIGNSATNPIENTGLLTILKFSRDMENEADRDGLQALQKCYGHINGATGVFEKLENLEQKISLTPPPFLSTHPLNEDRISNIIKLADDNNWVVSGELSKLLESIKKAKVTE